MKPETHLIVGAATGLGISLSQNLPIFGAGIIITTSAIVGSGLLDTSIVLQVMADDRAGRARVSTEKEGTLWFTLKEISHSPLIWLTGLLLLLLPLPQLAWLSVLAFTLGVLSHWVIDAFTHCGPEFRDTDQSLLWPLYYMVPGASNPGHIPKLGYLVGRLGIGWEYRYNYKDPNEYANLGKTKMFERVFQAATFILCLILFLRLIMM